MKFTFLVTSDASPSRERRDDLHFEVSDRRVERVGFVAADEELHVRTDAVLLVDDAMTDAREPRFEIDEDLGERRALRLDLRLALRVAAEMRRDDDLHPPTVTA